MTKKMVFVCDYCGAEFENENECKECERNHIKNYSESSNEDIAKELRRLELIAYDYRIYDSVMGMPITNFENLMREAVRRLNEKL